MRPHPLAFALSLSALAGCAFDTDGGEVEGASASVTCPPALARHPLGGPHNTGYDGAWSDFRCDGSLGNTDYGGDHHGIDIFAPRGTPVVSPVDGVIGRAGWPSSTSGNRVTVNDGCGWGYYHGHLDTILIAEGAWVRAGDVIGTVGNTGTPTSPHVHFNVHRDGNYSDDTDPWPLLAPVEHTSCGPDPACAGRGDGSFCPDATHIGTCTGGRFEGGDCGFFGTTCDMDTGAARCTPHLDGVFVGSDFPGGVRIEIPVGEEVRGCLSYRNTGSWAFGPGTTRLGTTEPRDRASEHQGSDWIGPNRLATVEAETPRGSDGRFCFSIHGAATPGERLERFSLVNEGMAWAADVGGVRDDVNILTIVTIEPRPDPMPAPDAGAEPDRDAGAPEGDASIEPPAPTPGRGELDRRISGGCSVTQRSGGRAGLALVIALALVVPIVVRRRQACRE